MTTEVDGVTKNLDYYLEHPDEFPTDPEAAAKLTSAWGSGEVLTEQPKTETKAEDKKEPDAALASATDGADKSKADVKVDGVLAKDGKNFLPYAEMERRIEEARKGGEAAARQATEEANQLVQQLKDQLTQKDAAIEAAGKGSGKKEVQADALAEIPVELMEQIREEFPSQAKILDALTTAIKQRDEQLESLRSELVTERGVRQRSDADVQAEEVRDLIAQNAELSSWQKDKPMLFNLAVEEEAKLLKDPAWVKANPELANDDVKRYAHVMTVVKQAVGLPAESPKDEKTADLEKVAEEKIKAAGHAPIHSLSDIKGGQPPNGNLEDNLESVPSTELADKLMQMTPEARDRWYARL